MAIKSNINSEGNTVTIFIDGRFDFTLHKDFRDAYTSIGKDKKISNYVIDLTGTNYMDSSALGMLLLLREFAGSSGDNISVRGCNSEIREILEISNFDRLFQIK